MRDLMWHIHCLSVCCLLLAACGVREPQWFSLEGETMGTTYHVRYFGLEDRKKDIDALLREINQSVSTYIPESVISQFNRTGYLAIPLDEKGNASDIRHTHFFGNLEEAYQIWKVSDGFFDPTVGVLVEAWGFGSQGRDTTGIDSSTVSALLEKVGLQRIVVEAEKDTIHVRAEAPGVALDFGALAKGYAVDEIAGMLNRGAISDYFIEIGGEVRVSGRSPRDSDWIVGISRPAEQSDPQDFAARLYLRNAAMATSGNYRNFYIRDGRKIWHTINPKTGFPEENNLLSATIIHPRCITADALATASMAMGVDEAIGMIRQIEGAKGYFIYIDMKGDIASFVTDNLAKDLIAE